VNDPESRACQALENSCYRLRLVKRKMTMREAEAQRAEIVQAMGSLLEEFGLTTHADDVREAAGEFRDGSHPCEESLDSEAP
jgi:hypothetical protein